MKRFGKALAFVLAASMAFGAGADVFAGYRPPVDASGNETAHEMNDITAFSVAGEILAPRQEVDKDGNPTWITKTIAFEDHSVMFRMPCGADVTALAPVIAVDPGAVISPPSGTPRDFTNPVKYTVTSSDGQPAVWTVTCYVSKEAPALTSDNAELQAAFNWAVRKTNDYPVTGKWSLINRDDNNLWGRAPNINQYFQALPAYWAGRYSRSRFCPRDMLHQSIGGHIAGWDDENYSMVNIMSRLATPARGYYTIWQINFNATPHLIDYTSDTNFTKELPTNFEVVEKAYDLYKWTGDTRYIDDPDIWSFMTNTVTNYVQTQDSRPANGIADAVGGSLRNGLAGYNERGGGIVTNESADAIGSQYKAYLAYANILQIKGRAADAQIWFDKAASLRDYFNNEWSVGPTGPQGLFVNAAGYNSSTGAVTKYDDFGRESSDFITYKTLAFPGDRNNRLLQFISESLKRGIIDNTSAANSPFANIESYTYIPEGFFRYDWNETAWRWMEYIYGRKDLPHEIAAQGTNGDYPEVSFTFVAQTIEGMMGVEADAPDDKVATGPRLPKDTTKAEGGALAGVNWVQVNGLNLGDHYLDIRHDGLTRTTLTNHSNKALTWEARFPGSYLTITVDGTAMPAGPININGVPYSAVTVTVPANGTSAAEAAAKNPPRFLSSISGRITGDNAPNGLPAQVTLKQLGNTVMTVSADPNGNYTFNNVPVGYYTLYASQSGYKDGALTVDAGAADNSLVSAAGLNLTLQSVPLTLDPLRTLYYAVGSSASTGIRNPTLTANPASLLITTNNGGGLDSNVAYVQTNSAAVGDWISMNVDVPADGAYNLDIIYKPNASGRGTIQNYFGPAGATGATVGPQLNELNSAIAGLGAADVTHADYLGCNASATTTNKYCLLPLAQNLTLTKGTYTLKSVCTAAGVIALVQVVLTPLSYAPPAADKTGLEALIAQAEALTPADYTADSWAALSAALSAAKAADADGAATQDAVDAAAAGLNAAIAALVPKPVTFTVTFDSAGGSAAAPQTVAAGGTAAQPADPARTGYTFAGWYLGGALYNFSAPVTDNITLTAQWTVKTYIVTFDSAGGSAVYPTDQQTVPYNGTAARPSDPAKTGYTFAGWYLGGAPYNFSAPVTANITLAAQWTPAGQVIPPTGITMSAAQTSLNMKVGTKLSLQITVSPPNADPSVTWSSSNPAVATVDPVTGQVTAIKTGSVRITVKSNADPAVSYMFLVMINA